jgi:hypothetical protein
MKAVDWCIEVGCCVCMDTRTRRGFASRSLSSAWLIRRTPPVQPRAAGVSRLAGAPLAESPGPPSVQPIGPSYCQSD